MDALPPSPPPSSSISLPPTSISSLDPSPSLSSPHSTNPTSKPLPLLPTELKRENLRFCDPSTLAKTSSLSLAFLQLSSPLLYDEIEITGFEALTKLFCPRDSSHQPQLESYLNLPKIRSLTFTSTSISTFETHLSSDRIPSSSTISGVEVDSLTLKLFLEFHGVACWHEFAELLDPRSVYLLGSSDPLPSFNLQRATWSNLSFLFFDTCRGSCMNRWNCLWGEGSDLTVVFTLSTKAFKSVLVSLCWCTDALATRVKRVAVRASSKKQNVLVQEGLMDLWVGQGLTGEDLARRKCLVTYEVVGEREI